MELKQNNLKDMDDREREKRSKQRNVQGKKQKNGERRRNIERYGTVKEIDE